MTAPTETTIYAALATKCRIHIPPCEVCRDTGAVEDDRTATSGARPAPCPDCPSGGWLDVPPEEHRREGGESE
jgi:hypothetical protein